MELENYIEISISSIYILIYTELKENHIFFFLFEEWKLMNKTDEKSRGRKKKKNEY